MKTRTMNIKENIHQASRTHNMPENMQIKINQSNGIRNSHIASFCRGGGAFPSQKEKDFAAVGHNDVVVVFFLCGIRHSSRDDQERD